MTITTESQVDNSLNPNWQMATFLHRLKMQQEEILRKLTRDQIDLDYYRSESGATGIITLDDQFKEPSIVTDVFATWSVLPGSTDTETQSSGSVTDPAANGIITSTSDPPAGLYTYTALAYLSGTVAAGDQNNMQLSQSLVQNLGKFELPAVANQIATLNGQVYLNGNQNLAVSAIAAGSGSSVVYNAAIYLQPLASSLYSVNIQISDRLIPVPYAPGFFVASFTKGMQVDIHQKINFQVSPAAQCFFEIMGYADRRRIDRD